MRAHQLKDNPRPDGTGGRQQAPSDPLLRAETAASMLPPLLVAAERVAATVSQGVHGRRRVGTGEAFWQFRRYQPGDPAARVDWRQSAKADRLYIRQREWEAAQSVWLWRDRSPSMHYRSAPLLPTKRETAELLVLALASLLIRGGERVALLGHDALPATARTTLGRLAAALESEDSEGGTDLPPAELLPRYARLVLFGDFLAPLEVVGACVHAFARHGVRGHLVQIIDPAEETLPFFGRVLFAGCEGDEAALFGRAEAVRDEYRTLFSAHQEGLGSLARAAGWTMSSHRCDQPPQLALLALYSCLAEGAPTARISC